MARGRSTHFDEYVDLDQWVVNKDLSLSVSFICESLISREKVFLKVQGLLEIKDTHRPKVLQ